MIFDGLRYIGGQRAAVADAGGAAVANGVETQRVEILRQARLVVIIRHHARAGRERGLYPRRRLQTLLHSLLGQQARRHHHVRIARVRARCNRRNHDGAVVADTCPRRRQIAFLDQKALPASPSRPRRHLPQAPGTVLRQCSVPVRRRLRLHRRHPADAWPPSPSHRTICRAARFALAFGTVAATGSCFAKLALRLRLSSHAVLRALRPRHAGLDCREVQLQRRRCTPPRAHPPCRNMPCALCSRPRPVAICASVAPRQPQVA